MSLKLVLDVDTGTDDAVAIMMAALHPDLNLVACTVVNGNANVDYCTDNTLRVLSCINRSHIPVYSGAYRPLARNDFPTPRDPNKPKALHGTTLPLPPTDTQAKTQHAAQFLVDYFKQPNHDTTLVAVGPLTNIALACTLDRDFAKNVERLIIMGGGHAIANTTASAEFNFWADPEAAAIVMSAGFSNIQLVTLDATHQALVTYDDCKQLVEQGSPASLAAELFIRQRIDVHEQFEKMDIEGSAPVHDALCIGALINPKLIKTQHLHVSVETGNAQSVGQSIIDVHKRSNQEANCYVALGADRLGFIRLLLDTLALT
ncbi:nucleoside hydrolase [Alteromonadaceae bacterium M269]|nr:nucleoside hydrolase [Alteromonadaceae bacterium M269]